MERDVLRYDQLDPAIEARVEALLAQMTPAEKVGQLVQVAPFVMPDPDELRRQLEQAEAAGQPFQLAWQPRPGLEEQVRAGAIGSLLNLADARLVNQYQRIAVEGSRLGIPLIIGSDVIHGFRTIFPIPLAEACTWDPELLERAARVAAEEASASGVDWIFAPMVDVARDPRWGRIAEGAGEDPFLGMALARARVRGFQAAGLASGRRIAACPKHYVAYGAAEAGRDYNTVDISERTLREVYLPPFKAAFDAGAGSVMSSFNEISGVPATSNAWLLRALLREEWRWPGLVLSDYEAVRELIPHGVAADLADAARLSMLAGLDMDMMSDAYMHHLAALVDQGFVSEQLVDEAAGRVLRLKLQLGLFERPYVDETIAPQIVLRDDYRALALQVAQESMVLLKNDGGLLPLTPGGQRIAVVGPLADAKRDLLGTWVLFGQAGDAESVLEGLRAALGDDTLTHVPGCPVQGDGPLDIPAAVAAAQHADVVVVVLGEGADMSGEARSRAHLGLPGRQLELLDALAQTGKPLIGVLMTGRPLVIPRMAEQVDALLVAWHGGIRAGRAVADILCGAANPSGKLTASWPRTEGQIPIYYAHKNTGRPMESVGVTQFGEPFKSRYIDTPNEPLFAFGHGLSYTTFEYRDLNVETPFVSPDGTLAVSAVIENTGARAGAEVVQLYVRDLVGSVTRPVKELKGFQRIVLAPGEARVVRFEVPAQQLGFWGVDMRYAVEPGGFTLWVGSDSIGGLEG
ncbi:MAG TPA: glycoside hydrolase family 3 N-terminal domain-containing protein, partial [Roseiflexaceae bacterium]|nr:glycoside hydrolase family 3 N-terminal domain-containing protein [Roseiflexaceae bacterium]